MWGRAILTHFVDVDHVGMRNPSHRFGFFEQPCPDKLASVNILVENGQGNPPDANDCKVWRSKFGQQKVRTFYDPTGAVTALWPEPGTTSMSAFVDEDRLIVSKLVHTSDLVAIMAGIEGALDH